MNQNNKKNLTNQEVLNKIDQIRLLVFEDKETRDREILEYLLGQRDYISWLDQDLLSFLADTREKARKRNLIQAITLGGEIIGFGGIGLGIAGIAIAAESIYVIPFIPVLMLYSPVFAAAGGGLLLFAIVSKMVRNMSPDKDVAEFNKLKEDIEQKYPEFKQEIKKSTKNKMKQSYQQKNNVPVVTSESGPGVPPPPPVPPAPPQVPTVPQTQKKAKSNDDKPKMSLEEELATKVKNLKKIQQPQDVEVKPLDKISNMKKQLEAQISKESPQNNKPIEVISGSGSSNPLPPPMPHNPPFQKLNIKKENGDKLKNAKDKIYNSKKSKEQNENKDKEKQK